MKNKAMSTECRRRAESAFRVAARSETMKKTLRIVLILLAALAVFAGGFALVQRVIYHRSALSGIADAYITLGQQEKV